MKFLRSLDLYKVIILLSIVLLPLGWLWVRNFDEQIRLCRDTIQQALKPGGLVEEIGTLQKKVKVVMANKRSASESINDPRLYFAGQILLSAKGGNLKGDDFSLPNDPKDEPANLGAGASAKQRATDYVVDIVWKRKELTVPMDFIFAVLWNCESGAREGGGDSGQQSVWKLRELSLVNATDDRLGTTQKTPPPQLDDKWAIHTMKFARREPRKGT